ncbi:MAG: hypothetical protein QF691_09055 [SAR324 cluster bacterium]|jgi:hypothetical protein|nr:hypothetical protein [SAR324 cluster bacterium]|tara:strand:- start:54 stop:383 length:330 start_codon:yes stop_codon:yes gene_type:complete
MALEKISAALIELTQPLLQQVDEQTTERQIDSAFLLAVTVWNAVVFDKRDPKNDYVKQMIGRANPQTLPLLKMLIERMNTIFGEEVCAISNYRVKYQDGELNVHAEATR